MIFWLLFRELMVVLDVIFKLDFYQDWWWNLALVAVVFYIGLKGYSQSQPARISFNLVTDSKGQNAEESPIKDERGIGNVTDPEKKAIAEKLESLMEKDRLYLQPDLSLQELAQHLQINGVQLSAAINQVFKKNFNEYINSLRIEEFIRNYHADNNRRFTILSIALDSGFNSKATFNRAFKKIKGISPQEFFNV
jgi:YesN/AraC family two-component response regulator